MPPKKQKKHSGKTYYDVIKDLDPDCIKDEDIWAAYKINCVRCEFNCRRNCKGNPFCLSDLGDRQWLDDDNNIQFEQETEDPRQYCRKPGTHVGLENLGATCYVNSLLQLWFHNPRFRRALYDWNPLEDPLELDNQLLMKFDEYVPCSEIGHLQALFALMAFSERAYLDPKDFVESLGLDPSTQQDAQEFSKLFVSLLEERFKSQSDPRVRNMITKNFQGQYSYLTRCSGCQKESVSPSTFYELELNIMGHKTLDGSLAEFLEEEKLEGVDKYSCSVCGDKQEAVRFIKLQTLPPTLNLQLMRFVYDRQKGYKKKLNSCLLFPEVLDMTNYVESSKSDVKKDYNVGDAENCDDNDCGSFETSNKDCDQKEDENKENTEENQNKKKKTKAVEYVYNLTAVLAHKGSSANSGHYIACIKDSAGAWYTFNDQAAIKSEGKKLKLPVIFEENDVGSKPNNPRVPKGYLSSTKAYMLVYTRIDCDQNSAEALDLNDFEKLDERLRTYVKRNNDIFRNWIEVETSVRNTVLATSSKLKDEIRAIILSLAVDGSTEVSSFEVLPLDWILHWLKSAKDKVNPIENHHYTCTHDKLNPDSINRIKFINRQAGDVLFSKYGGGPRLIGDDIFCKQCIISRCKQLHSNYRISEDYKKISNLLKVKMNEGEPGFWIVKESLKRWKQLVKLDDEHEFPEVNGFTPELGDLAATAHLENESSEKTKEGDIINSEMLTEKFLDDNEIQETNRQKAGAGESAENVLSLCPIQKKKIIDSSLSSGGNRVPNKKVNLRSVRLAFKTNKNEPPLPVIKEGVSDDDICTSNDSFQCKYDGKISCDLITHRNACISEYGKIRESIRTLFKELKPICDREKLSEDYLKIYEQLDSLMNRESVLFNSKIKFMLTDSSFCDCRYGVSDCTRRNSFIKSCKMLRLRGVFHKKLSLNNDDNKSELRTCNGDHCSNIKLDSLDEERSVESDSVSQDSINCKDMVNSETSEGVLEDKRSSKTKNLNNNHTEFSNGVDTNNCAKFDDEGDEDMENDGKEFNEALICSHGNLTIDENIRRLVPVKVWEILKTYFPSARTFPHDAIPCQQCQNRACEYEVVMDQCRKQALCEKEQLKDLFLGRNRPDLEKIEENTEFYVIPTDEFVNPWRQFLRKAGREQPPSSLATSALICKHGLLAICLMRDAERFVLVTEEEWNILSKNYSADSAITVWSVGDTVLSKPGDCTECRNERVKAETKALLNYDRAVIYVQKIQSGEEALYVSQPEDPEPCVPANLVEDGSSEPKKLRLNMQGHSVAGQDVRRSSRRRKRREQTVISISSTNSLMDFKLKVMHLFGALPSDQHLIYNGKELVENDRSLSELEIYPQSTIYLNIDEPTGTEEDPYQENPKNRELEAGFKGTKLIS